MTGTTDSIRASPALCPSAWLRSPPTLFAKNAKKGRPLRGFGAAWILPLRQAQGRLCRRPLRSGRASADPSPSPCSGSGFRRAAQTPRKRLKLQAEIAHVEIAQSQVRLTTTFFMILLNFRKSPGQSGWAAALQRGNITLATPPEARPVAGCSQQLRSALGTTISQQPGWTRSLQVRNQAG